MPAKALTGASAQTIVLSILSHGENYGYEIVKRVYQLSAGDVEWSAGSLYTLMHRMKASGLVESYWVEKEGERRRRYYRITAKGAASLEREKQEWLSVHGIFVQLWGLQPSLS
ncbi:MAG: PadR family transcriptional regulator [Bacteroidota bacterium]